MKKIYWMLPLFLIACKQEKTNQSTIFGNSEERTIQTDNNEEETYAEELVTKNVGKQYTDLTIPKLEGGTARLSDYVKKNKVTVIDCWASWCRPCMMEMPNVAQLYRKYHSLGVEIVGISFDQEQQAWNSTVKNHDMVWPQLSELKGWDNQMFDVYGVRGIPHTIVINQQGLIIAEGLRGEALVDAVARELKK